MLTAQAQLQLTNSDFETWETVTYTSAKTCEEPVCWSSFYDATGSMKSMGTGTTPQIYKDEDVRPGSAGHYSCRITSRSVFGVVAQGNLTTGCVNMGSASASDASGNYNYINEARNDQAMRFSGHPDAVRFWVRFSGVKAGNCSVMLTTKGYYQDPAYGERNTATLVAQALSGSSIVSNDTWTQYTVPFEWVSDEEPYYALVNVSTCSQPGAGNAADYLYIDDMEMVYGSEATAVYYDGRQILNAGTQSTSFKIDKMGEITVNGKAATASWTFDYEAYELVVRVEGENVAEDPDNVHTYRIAFTKPAAQLLTAEQDGVNLLENAEQVVYHAERAAFTFNDDVTAHSETFDKSTCQLTIVMTDKATGEEVEHILQFHKPEPELLSAKWKGETIDLEGFSTREVYKARSLALSGNSDATIVREFNEETCLLTVTAKAEEGYEEYDKVYYFQFGMGEMEDPSQEVIQPATLVRGNSYYIRNVKNGLLLTDGNILGTVLTEWTVDADGNIMSADGKYVNLTIETDEGSAGTGGSANPKSVSVSSDAAEATAFTVAGNAEGYTISVTKTWKYGGFLYIGRSDASYTGYLTANAANVAYTDDADDEACLWQFYDVAAYRNRAVRAELYQELQRAEQVGIDIKNYRQTMEANAGNTETMQNLLYEVRSHEASFVSDKYPVDCTEMLGSTDLTNTEYWTNDLEAKAWGQHWSGDDSRVYYEMGGDLWWQAGWSAGAQQTVNLPAGDYALKAIARSGALTTAYIDVDGNTVTFPANGDTGRGVDVNGDVNYSSSGTYCNEGLGRGWEYRYVTFSLPQRSDVNISVGASTDAQYQWFSVCDISLMAAPIPELKMLAFAYDNVPYLPDEMGNIDISDSYYREDLIGGVLTGGYGQVSMDFDVYSSVLTVTLSQEEDGYDYELEPVEYKVQFRLRQPGLEQLTYDGVDVTDGTRIDAYYRPIDLLYTGNTDTESVQVTFNPEDWSVTVVAMGYEREKSYVLYFKDASQVSTQYTEMARIEVNGELISTDEITVNIVEQEERVYEFVLPNFVMGKGDEATPIGTVSLPGLAMQLNDAGVNCFSTQQSIEIAAGDVDGVPTSNWIGPWLGALPVDLTPGYVYGDRLYARIVIDAQETLDQTIVVTVGDLNNIPTAVNALPESAEGVTPDGKYIINGRVVIVKDGKRYSVSGTKF